MNNKIKVSFVVIGYNIESYIEKCLSSIKKQTLNDIEIIAVDDGSTDKTFEIMKKTLEGFENSLIIHQKNKGQDVARGLGLSKASGEYIAFVDGDDWVESNMAEELYKESKDSGCDLICFGNYCRFDDGKTSITVPSQSGIYKEFDFLKFILLAELSCCTWDKFFRRSLVSDIFTTSNHHYKFSEDLYRNITIGLKQPKAYFIQKPYYNYYQRSSSILHSKFNSRRDIFDILENVDNIFKNNGLYGKFNKEIEFLWFRHLYIGFIIYDPYVIDDEREEAYKIWVNRNINIYKNEYIKNYIKTRSIIRRISIYLGNGSYKFIQYNRYFLNNFIKNRGKVNE